MKIALIDIDGHAKKKKWGATVPPYRIATVVGVVVLRSTVEVVIFGEEYANETNVVEPVALRPRKSLTTQVTV